MEELLKKIKLINQNMFPIISKDSLLMRCEVWIDQEVGVNNHITPLCIHR